MKFPIVLLTQFLAIIFLLKSTTNARVEASVGLYGPDRYEGLPEICLMPMDFGYCRAKVQRYYFDIRRMKCTMFYWGGCAGNDNNFKSLEECNEFCTSAYEDHIHNEVVVQKEPTVKESKNRGTSNTKFINSRDNKSAPKFAVKADITSKETGYKSSFKASPKSISVNAVSKPNINSDNDDNNNPLDNNEDEVYDDVLLKKMNHFL